ncbi:hypothetical protein MTO96_012428 [Rhipicephalus appendiculatus]
MSLARFSLSEFEDPELPPWSPEFYSTDGFSPPSQPSTLRLRGAGKRRRLRKLSTVAATPEDRNYLCTSADSFSMHTRRPRKPYWTHASSSNANHYAHHRRPSFGSRDFANGGVTGEEALSASRPQQAMPRTQYVSGKGRNRAAVPPRQGRRRSTHDITAGEDSAVTVGQLRTPIATTDVNHRSHGRVARQPRQSAIRPARRPWQSPPRNIIVFSKPRSRSLAPPPKIDDFSDIPPTEVICFDSPVTRLLSSRLDRLHHPSPGRVTSPGKAETALNIPARLESPPSQCRTLTTPQASEVLSVPEETDERRTSPAGVVTGGITFTQIWLFCTVAAATLLLPFVFLIFSYLLTPASGVTAESYVTGGTMSSTASSVLSPSSFTLPTWPTHATVNPWAGVPAACRQRRATSDNITGVMQRNSFPATGIGVSELFCLYNSSRFLRNSSASFLPQNLPLSLCQYIVYWSFRLVDGRLLSRTPTFDHFYGLAQLKGILKNARVPDVKVLLAVGGYVEDNPQFSLLGRDDNARARFVKGATRQLRSRNIDGLVLHWVEAEPGCRNRNSGAGSTALRAVFVDLRRVFDLNGLRPTPILAVIVPGQVDDGILGSVIDLVDYVFLETHKTLPQPPLNYDVCTSVATRMLDQIKNRQSLHGNERKACITFSVAPWKFEANGSRQLPNLSSLSRSGDPPFFGSAVEMCRSSPCLLNAARNNSCVGVRMGAPSGFDACVVVHGRSADSDAVFVWPISANARTMRPFPGS